MNKAAPLLAVENLVVEFDSAEGVVHAVNGVSFTIGAGETLCIVGESGSGKTVSALAVLGLLGSSGNVVGGSIRFAGEDLLTATDFRMQQVRGKEIGFIWQEPMAAFNPVTPIGKQVSETLLIHGSERDGRAAKERVIGLFGELGIPEPRRRFDEYPHEFSGGMLQRALIAMACCNNPRLVIADEPTTALDVTIQAQVLDSLRRAQRASDSALVLITHDLGVVAEMADRVVVLYGGAVAEEGNVETIFGQPRHPYSVGLISSMPRIATAGSELVPIRGNPPSLLQALVGCPFEPRCEIGGGRQNCLKIKPVLRSTGLGSRSACHFSDEVEAFAKSRIASSEVL